MPKFSSKSQERLNTCHPDLQRLFNEVIKHWDCSILCGHRNKLDQDEAHRAGFSQVSFPNSKHNSLPSNAVDVMPWPVDWNDRDRLYMFIGFVRGVAAQMGIKIRSGADWNGNMEVKDESFRDLPHWEIKE